MFFFLRFIIKPVKGVFYLQFDKKEKKGGVMVSKNTNLSWMNKVKKASAHNQNILHGDTSMYNIKRKVYKTV